MCHVYYYIFITPDALLLHPEFFTAETAQNILKYSSSINMGGISNVTSAPQNTITTDEKAESVAQYSSTLLL
jgi:hypothetical protein